MLPNRVQIQEGDAASYRRILATTSITGGASVLTVLIGLLRMKFVALLLGPAGVGLAGLLASLMQTLSTAAALGLDNVGTRQIAEANATHEPTKVCVAQQSLSYAALALACLGMLTTILLAKPLAAWVLGDSSATNMMYWLAVGVGLSVVSIAQSALVRGLGKIKELALLGVLSAGTSAVIGIPILYVYGAAAIPAYVVLGPLATFMLGLVVVGRLPSVRSVAADWTDLKSQWAVFLRLGIPFAGSALVTVGFGLLFRMEVEQQLGLASVGHFQAAWTIASIYVGFVLSAMGADYLPRLTGEISRPADATRLVNQQSEIALLLSGPVILLMIALAPWVIALLYTQDFMEAGPMLQWMALGTTLKVASWPLGFVMVAAGAGRTFFLSELGTFLFMLALTSVALGEIGLEGAGIAYVLGYVVYLPLVYWIALNRINFGWSREVWMTLTAVAASSAVVFVTSKTLDTWSSLPIAAVSTILLTAYVVWRFGNMELGVVDIIRHRRSAAAGSDNQPG